MKLFALRRFFPFLCLAVGLGGVWTGLHLAGVRAVVFGGEDLLRMFIRGRRD